MNPGGQSTGTQTGADGSYTTSPLPPGDYKVQFSDNGPNPAWARQYWNNKPTWNTADTLTLATDRRPGTHRDRRAPRRRREDRGHGHRRGRRTAGRDLRQRKHREQQRLGRAGRHHDRQRRHLHHRPAAPHRPARPVPRLQQPRPLRRTVVRRPVGLQQLDPESSSPQATTATASTPNSPPVSRCPDRVTDPDGNPLAGISVNVNPQNSGPSGWGQTDSNGLYTTSAIPPGSYRVQFSASGPHPAWATQYWHAKLSYNTRRPPHDHRGRRPRPWRRRCDADRRRHRSREP